MKISRTGIKSKSGHGNKFKPNQVARNTAKKTACHIHYMEWQKKRALIKKLRRQK